MRLADKVLTEPAIVPMWMRIGDGREVAGDFYRELREALAQGVPVIEADNVARYFFSANKVWIVNKDFPNLAPPFRTFWVEHKIPRAEYTALMGEAPSKSGPDELGVLFRAEESEDQDRDGYRWELRADLVGAMSNGKGVMAPLGTYKLWVDGNGEALRYSIGVYVSDSIRNNPIPEKWAPLIARTEEDLREDEAWDGRPIRTIGDYSHALTVLNRTMFYPSFLALSFMHCRNVHLQESPAFAPKWEKRYRERHEGVGPVRYHTIVVEPMKKILDEAGAQPGGEGLQKALHIMRGHFKTYLDRPLFGKYTGSWWWDDSVRGKAEAGVVVTDYKVKAPTSRV